LQTALEQSLGTLHRCPAAQRAGQAAPPQSIPVSSWFETPSVQVAGWQTLPVHRLLLQSVFAAQPAASGHGPHAAPPQSVSVSVPLRRPSLHWGDAHTRAGEQYEETQSAPVMHPPPSGQSPHEAPPQSTPVSVPFFTPSVQVAVWQAPALQTRLAQSAESEQP
jgi:hypothetical protein